MGKTRTSISYCALSILAMALVSNMVFAAVTSGVLVVYNDLANVADVGGVGNTATPIQVHVKDAMGVCYTAPYVSYGGSVSVAWRTSNTHSASACTDITSVDITPLATAVGVIYGTSDAVPASGTVTYTAPTLAYSNMVLIPSGQATEATMADMTHWGNRLGIPPTFDSGNGMLVTAGVPGVRSMYGANAEAFMRRLGHQPIV